MEEIKRPVIVVSFPRSATDGIAQFFHKFGIDAAHQVAPSTSTNSDPINFPFVPGAKDKYAEQKVKLLHQFEATWELAWHMLALKKLNPEIRFLIMIRNPINACNSLLHYRNRNGLKRNLNDLALMWTSLYQIIFQQAIRMKDKPKWMLFEKYIKGDYTKKLFNLFGMPITKKTIKQADQLLSYKANTQGEYQLNDSSYFVLCEQIKDIITLSLKEL